MAFDKMLPLVTSRRPKPISHKLSLSSLPQSRPVLQKFYTTLYVTWASDPDYRQVTLHFYFRSQNNSKNFFFSVHRIEGFSWNPPWTWIKQPKLYVRLACGHGRSCKTIEINGTEFEWNEKLPMWVRSLRFVLELLTTLCYSDIEVDDDVVISLKGRTFLGTRIVIGSFTIRAEDLLKQSQATPEGMCIHDLPVCQGEHNRKYC